MPRGRGGGRAGPLPRATQVSKRLSRTLRHSAAEDNIPLDSRGYVNVGVLLQSQKYKSMHITFSEVLSAVRENDKKRFGMLRVASQAEGHLDEIAETTEPPSDADAEDPRNWLIRARQGHSLQIANEALLKELTTETVPEVVVHGTTAKAWEAITESGGLKRMGRTHVHFAKALPAGMKQVEGLQTGREGEAMDVGGEKGEKAEVVSGMRLSSTILVFVDAVQAIREGGLRFWESENGVVLCEGDANGMIPMRFFSRVEDRRRGGRVLVVDGKAVEYDGAE